jgi:cytochrome c oxidase cbb3-type subunit 3
MAPKWKLFLICFGLGLAFVVNAKQAPVPNSADTPNTRDASPSTPVPGVPTASQGRQIFIQNCTFCHGPDARGGAEGGPDLTRSTMATGDATASQLIGFLKDGRPPRMPAFPNLSDDQVKAVAAFIRSQSAPLPGPGVAGRARVPIQVVGDASAGEQFFNGTGKCATCHSAAGDMKGIGGKYDAMTLQGKIALPRGSGGYPGLNFGAQSTAPEILRTVTVIETNGHVTTGQLVSISDFDVTLRDPNGVTHTFGRNSNVPKVEVKDPLQAHLDMLPKLTDQELHNLTAYLVTLK